MAKRLMMIMISVLMVFSLLVPTVSAEDSSGTLGEEETINEVVDEELPSTEVTDEGDETEVEIIEDDKVSTSGEENETVEEVIEEEKDPATATEAQDEPTIVEEGTSDDTLQVQSNDQDAEATDEDKAKLKAYLSGEDTEEFHLKANYDFDLNTDGYLEVIGEKTLVTTIFDLTAEGNFTDGATAFIVIRPGATLNLRAGRSDFVDFGKISLKSSGTSYTILNFGTLNVNGSVIENTSEKGVVIHNGNIDVNLLNGELVGEQSNEAKLEIKGIEAYGANEIELAVGAEDSVKVYTDEKIAEGQYKRYFNVFENEATANKYADKAMIEFYEMTDTKDNDDENDDVSEYFFGDLHNYLRRRFGHKDISCSGHILTIKYIPKEYSKISVSIIPDLDEGLTIRNGAEIPVGISHNLVTLATINPGESYVVTADIPYNDYVVQPDWTNDFNRGVYVGKQGEETIKYGLGEKYPFANLNDTVHASVNLLIEKEGLQADQSVKTSLKFANDNEQLSSVYVIASGTSDGIKFSMPEFTDDVLEFDKYGLYEINFLIRRLEEGVYVDLVSVTYLEHSVCSPFGLDGGLSCGISYPLGGTEEFEIEELNKTQTANIKYLHSLEVSVESYEDNNKDDRIYVVSNDNYGITIDNNNNDFDDGVIMPKIGADINTLLKDDVGRVFVMGSKLKDALVIKNKHGVTIDLQRSYLSSLDVNALIIDGSEITIKNGTIYSHNGDTVVIKNGSTVSFEDVTIIHEGNDGVPLKVEGKSTVKVEGSNSTLILDTSGSSSGSAILDGGSNLYVGKMSYLKGVGSEQFIKVENDGSNIIFEDGSFFEMAGELNNKVLIYANESQVEGADKVDLVFDNSSGGYKKESDAQAPIESVEQDENANNNNDSFKEMLEVGDGSGLDKYIDAEEDKSKISELKEQATKGTDNTRSIYVEIESSPMNMNAEDFQSDIDLINGDQDIKEAEGKLVNLVNIDAKLKVDVEVGNITSSKEVKLSKLPEAATITIYLPHDNYDPEKTYQVARVHGGVVTLLDTTVGSVDFRGLPLTFASDLFSTYGVVEVNKQTGGNDPGSDDDQGGSQIDPPRIPSSPSHSYTDKDLPSNTKECQKEFGDEYIWSDEYDACVIKFMIPDTATK